MPALLPLRPAGRVVPRASGADRRRRPCSRSGETRLRERAPLSRLSPRSQEWRRSFAAPFALGICCRTVSTWRGVVRYLTPASWQARARSSSLNSAARSTSDPGQPLSSPPVQRDADPEGRPAWLGIDSDAAPMAVLHDAADGVEPQACPLADSLGREERLEDAIAHVGGDAGA